jgi:hypothetical protein
MANRFPLIVDSSSQQIKELPDGDSLLLGDNEKLNIGDGLDLQIYHDGSNSYINDVGTGSLYIKATNLSLADAAGEQFLNAYSNGGVLLYHNNVQKFETNAGGIGVAGHVVVPNDTGRVKLGTGGDFEIFHDGTDSFIDNATGDLKLRTPNNFRVTDLSNNKMILCQDGGETQLYHDGTEKLNTTATGATITGTLVADGLSMGDSEIGKFGTSNDLQIYHDGSNSYVKETNTSSDLLIQSNNIVLEKTDGENMIHCAGDGAVQLYHNNVSKIATTATGATVTGLVTATTSANITQVALTSSSNAVAWDARAAANAYHVTTENTTFAAPSNAIEGAIISVEIAQGGTARTIAWNTVFEFAASTAPTITATANKTDILAFRYNGSVWQEIGRVQNMAQT